MSDAPDVEWAALYVLHNDITIDERRAVATFLGHSGLATKEEVRAYLKEHGRRGLRQQLALPMNRQAVSA